MYYLTLPDICFFFPLLHMERKRLVCFQKTFFMSEHFLLKKALEFLQKLFFNCSQYMKKHITYRM